MYVLHLGLLLTPKSVSHVNLTSSLLFLLKCDGFIMGLPVGASTDKKSVTEGSVGEIIFRWAGCFVKIIEAKHVQLLEQNKRPIEPVQRLDIFKWVIFVNMIYNPAVR